MPSLRSLCRSNYLRTSPMVRDGADVLEFHLNIMRHFSGMLINQESDFLLAVGK